MSNRVIKNTFETIEGITKGVVNDAKQSITGQYPSDTPKPQPLPDQQKKAIKSDDSQQIQAVRQNLAKINQQIVEIRKKRENKVVQEERKEDQKKQEKQYQEKKKESLLSKIIKSQKGTKEGVNRVGG